MVVSSEKCNDVKVKNCGLCDDHSYGREAQEAVVEDLLVTEHQHARLVTFGLHHFPNLHFTFFRS